MKTNLMNPPRRIWISLPVDEGSGPDLRDGDLYIVRRKNGEELWAAYIVDNGAGFFACDDEGNAIGEALGDIAAVMARGYSPGFGPSCPRAGAPERIHLLVIQ